MHRSASARTTASAPAVTCRPTDGVSRVWPSVPVGGAHAERHRRDAERERDLVVDHRATDQPRQLAEPRGAACRVADDVLQPGGQRLHTGRRELLEGQRGHRGPVVQAEEAGQRRQRPGGQPGGLSADQSEDEVEGRVIELVKGVGPDREVPRRAPRLASAVP